MINISIFGTCVSRDIFKKDDENFSVKTYVMRQNLASIHAEPVECKRNDINLKSNFQINTIYNDFSKITFEQFENDDSNFLLIELINERLPILKYKDSYISISEFLETSKYIEDLEVLRKTDVVNYTFENNCYSLEGTDLRIFLDNFIYNILLIYSPNQIILNKAHMSYKYIDKNNNIQDFSKGSIDWSKRINKRLSYMYDYLEEKFKGCKIIDICDKYYANELNKWGLSPTHYEDKYHEECYRLILEYCNSFKEKQNSNSINKSIVEDLIYQNKELSIKNEYLINQKNNLISENNKINGQLKWVRKELDIVRFERLQLKKQLSNIQSSRSYKILKKLMSIYKKILNILKNNNKSIYD